MTTPIAEPRIMPARVVYGSGGQCSIKSIAFMFDGWHRALAPGERRLGRFIVPPFQRGLVWTTEQKAKLIESIYLGLPIGAIIWNQTTNANPCDQWILDGQQRSSAICEYLAGEFPVYGWRYPDLPQIERRHFDRMGVGELITNITTEEGCRDIYERLVYGGTPHDPRETRHGG